MTRACHANLDDDQEPQPCALERGDPAACPIAERLDRRGLTQAACEYWLPVQGPTRSPLVPDDGAAARAHIRLAQALPTACYTPLQIRADIERLQAVGPAKPRVLAALTALGYDLTITDIAEETGCPTETVRKILTDLAAEGVIVRNQSMRGNRKSLTYRSRTWLD